VQPPPGPPCRKTTGLPFLLPLSSYRSVCTGETGSMPVEYGSIGGYISRGLSGAEAAAAATEGAPATPTVTAATAATAEAARQRDPDAALAAGAASVWRRRRSGAA